MHRYKLASSVLENVQRRRGKLHAYDNIVAERTALLVIDMQNYFVAPGYLGEIAAARAIVPNINRLARELRIAGGQVVWVQNASAGPDDWSHLHQYLWKPELAKRRNHQLQEGSEGFALWPEMDVAEGDHSVRKFRFSAFIRGSSELEDLLRKEGIDMLLIAGTATNICCESTARDAMMLNFKTIMLADATATFSEEEHNASLACFLSFFGDVMTVDEAIARLSPSPKTRSSGYGMSGASPAAS
jgi:ureidoacrylate peracid hydrolase